MIKVILDIFGGLTPPENMHVQSNPENMILI